MSSTERRLRNLALRVTTLLGIIAAVAMLSPLALKTAGAQANGGCNITCPDGSWCWVQGTPPCICTCPADGGAYCACQDIIIDIKPIGDDDADSDADGVKGGSKSETGG
jgi:hypothetical protein